MRASIKLADAVLICLLSFPSPYVGQVASYKGGGSFSLLPGNQKRGDWASKFPEMVLLLLLKQFCCRKTSRKNVVQCAYASHTHTEKETVDPAPLLFVPRFVLLPPTHPHLRICLTVPPPPLSPPSLSQSPTVPAIYVATTVNLHSTPLHYTVYPCGAARRQIHSGAFRCGERGFWNSSLLARAEAPPRAEDRPFEM